MRETLTPKQAAFVEAYLTNGRNAAAAYRAAYSTSASPKHAGNEGLKLLRHPVIAREVAEADRKAHAKLAAFAERNAVTRERISAELASIAFAAAPEQVPVRDKRAALMDLAKLHGHVTEKRETRVIRTIEDLTREELEALVQSGERRERKETTH
jgi:hypothetical protein